MSHSRDHSEIYRLVGDLEDESITAWAVATLTRDDDEGPVTWAITRGDVADLRVLVGELSTGLTRTPAETSAQIHRLLTDLLDSPDGLDWTLVARRPETDEVPSAAWSFVQGDHDAVRALVDDLADALDGPVQPPTPARSSQS